jgi:hypothetical protein
MLRTGWRHPPFGSIWTGADFSADSASQLNRLSDTPKSASRTAILAALAALGHETAELFAQRSVLCSVSPDSCLLVRESAALNNDNNLDASTFNYSKDLVLGESAWERASCSCGRERKSTSKGPSRSAEWIELDRIAAGGNAEDLMTGGR